MNYAIILSGGTGTRLGADIPKQYIKVNGRDIITYCMKTLLESPFVDGLVIVAANEWQSEILGELKILTEEFSLEGKADLNDKFLGFAEPGANRQFSILSGLYEVRKHCEACETVTGAGDVSDKCIGNEHMSDKLVLIHDAARPCLSQGMISECFTSCEGHDGVLPVLPMKDTVYFSEDGKAVKELLDRSKVYAGQAPEVFRLDKYIAANEALLPDRILSINGSTEPAIMAGMDIAMIPGDEGNYKITTKADLERFVASRG